MSLYFLAILPDENLKKEINTIKKSFADTYNCHYAYNKITHITLQKPFCRNDEHLPNLKDNLSAFFNSVSTFPIKLSGFGHFGDRVIYIKIADPEPLQSLRKHLIECLQQNLDFTDKMIGRRNFTPHITIANRDLTKTKFNKAWENYKNMTFKESFECNQVWLLKHDGKRWQPDYVFELNE